MKISTYDLLMGILKGTCQATMDPTTGVIHARKFDSKESPIMPWSDWSKVELIKEENNNG